MDAKPSIAACSISQRAILNERPMSRMVALPPTSTRKVVDVAIKGHVIAEATLTGRYAKKGSKR